MRTRARAVVAAQAIGPQVVLLTALIIALVLLLAAPAKAQETTSEETTVLASDAENRRVEAKTDKVSVEVDNGKVSVNSDTSSSSNDSTNQQSSMTVQQTQTHEGSGSRASTRDVNTTQNSNEFSIVIRQDDGSEVARDSASADTTEDLIVDEPAGTYDLEATVQPENGTTYTVTVDDCLPGTSTTTCEDPNQLDRITNPDRSLTFETTADRFRVSYTVNFRDSNSNSNNNNNNNNKANGRGAADRQYKNEKIVRETVIKKTIPDKGKLANTGGVPLAEAGLLALASVGLGLSILRFTIRRDP